jgi:hypothetical protein
MREEFEKWAVTEDGGLVAANLRWMEGRQTYYWAAARMMWDAWKAANKSLVPDWRPMSDEPPFPFRGDIFSGGKIIINADWAGGGLTNGYWQTQRGDRGIDQVTHWKPRNPPIPEPDK